MGGTLSLFRSSFNRPLRIESRPERLTGKPGASCFARSCVNGRVNTGHVAAYKVWRLGLSDELVPEVYGGAPRAARTAYRGVKAVVRVGKTCGPWLESGNSKIAYSTVMSTV